MHLISAPGKRRQEEYDLGDSAGKNVNKLLCKRIRKF
jgi:hypothetical protein